MNGFLPRRWTQRMRGTILSDHTASRRALIVAAPVGWGLRTCIAALLLCATMPVWPAGAWPVSFLLAGLVVLHAIMPPSIVEHRGSGLRGATDGGASGHLAPATLAQREAQLRGIVDNAAAGVVEIDAATGRFIRVNRIFCEMLGRSEAALLGPLDLLGLTSPEDRAEQARQWEGIRETGQPFHSERRYLRPDGGVLWFGVGLSVAMTGPDGRPTRLVAVVQDVTERKAAEAALQASQEMLRLSLDIGGVGTFRRDYVAGVIHCGPDTRQMAGLPLDEAPIESGIWLRTVPDEDRPKLLEDAAQAQAERREVVSFEYRFIHPDKGVRYAETRSRVSYDEAGRATGSVGVIIDVTDRRLARDRLEHLAHHDSLTGLPNRTLFGLRLDGVLEAARHGAACAVFCIDLDNFKDVNDALGHPVGDGLLRAVTERLRGACRESDTIARLGGDEFAIIQYPLGDRGEAVALAERVKAVLSRPFAIDGHRVTAGVSMGIVVAPDDGLDADLLLREADLALYNAKAAGRGRYRVFKAAMSETVRARRVLDAELRVALDRGDLELFYQPLVDVATQRIRSFEALLRWRHPQRGMIMPDSFIPLAESNGLIVPIGAFVLRRACLQATSWPHHIAVAVNLSASEFASPDLVRVVAEALADSGLDPQRLGLEITETTMLHDTQSTTETLGRLKALGVSLSVDDFGTGFSSLGYLQRFPFDKVKIDRSFIARLGETRESFVIVQAVVGLGRGLGMAVTAEGVETEDQLAILSDLDCTEAQGYFFSRPCPFDQVAAVIDRLETVAEGRHGRPNAPTTRRA